MHLSVLNRGTFVNYKKRRIGLMRVMIVVGNKDIYVIQNLLKVINILMRTIYLILTPLVFVKHFLL